MIWGYEEENEIGYYDAGERGCGEVVWIICFKYYFLFYDGLVFAGWVCAEWCFRRPHSRAVA